MKNILFISPDLSLCASLLMYFNEKYSVTTTTNSENIEQLVQGGKYDLVLIDYDPHAKILEICKKLHELPQVLPTILTYVYTPKFQELDTSIRKYVSAVFYKPYDIEEISIKIENMISRS